MFSFCFISVFLSNKLLFSDFTVIDGVKDAVFLFECCYECTLLLFVTNFLAVMIGAAFAFIALGEFKVLDVETYKLDSKVYS